MKGRLGRGWAYEFVVVSNCACSVMGKPDKRELRPRELRVGGLWTVTREVACSGAGCQGALGNPWEQKAWQSQPLKQPL